MPESIADFLRQLNDFEVPITRVSTLASEKAECSWSLLRLDLVDEQLSGNKAFKLLPALQQASQLGKSTLISFGGFHSNHIHALAAAGKRFGFDTVGLIRGYQSQPISPTLIDAQALGMQLFYLGVEEYKKRDDEVYQSMWLARFPQACLIPEGAADGWGVRGCELMANLIAHAMVGRRADLLTVCAGTGVTAKGLILSGLFSELDLQIFCALKKKAIHQLQCDLTPNVKLIDEYCLGGFAKMPNELLRFMWQFEQNNKVLLDPVYTAKMMFGIDKMISAGVIAKGSHIYSIHTGGVQGRRAIADKLEHFTKELSL